MTGPTTSTLTLTSAELDALPVGAAVRCTTDYGRVVLALKVGVPQGSGGHIWRTTEYSTHPGSFAIAQANAVLLEPAEPGPTGDVVQVDGDNPALAAADVQAGALTGADQVSDVVNARHAPVVGHSRHDAPRDIPSSAGGPATTPALARATEAVSAPIPDINRLSHAEIRQWLARAAVSAALLDPDGRLASAVENAVDAHLGDHDEDCVLGECVLAWLRAVALGRCPICGDGGDPRCPRCGSDQ